MDLPSLAEPIDPAALLAEAEADMAAINDALRRLDDGNYGRCGRCSASLSDAQLAADPLAQICDPSCA